MARSAAGGSCDALALAGGIPQGGSRLMASIPQQGVDKAVSIASDAQENELKVLGLDEAKVFIMEAPKF